ncbi:MAG TPA: T9SS type A sorting domain-containing protein, partial [Bacteroidota bacterium]|nr:T9SS type A sorting domain-containing protein [Bacteroidota bacterium]
QGKSEFPLQISGAVYPLTITWDGANDGGTYTLLVGSGKEKKEFPISGAGRVVLTDEDAVVKIGITSAQHAEMPKAYALYQNYPNPFNPSTTIRFDVPKASNISLKIYDVLGQEVETLVNEERGAGRYSVNFDAGNFPSGVYYFRIIAGDFSDVKKLLLAK